MGFVFLLFLVSTVFRVDGVGSGLEEIVKRLQRFSGELQKMLMSKMKLDLAITSYHDRKTPCFFCHRPRKAFKTNYGKVESVNG